MKKALALLLGAVLAVALLVTAWASWGLRRDNRLAELWKQEIFDGLAPSERFPARQRNESAFALEALAAEIGLELSTGLEGGATPSEEAAARWERADKLLKAYQATLNASTTDRSPARDPELDDFLIEAGEPLVAVQKLLTSQEPPAWVLEIEGGFDAPIPNFLGQMRLHRLLAVAAHRALDEGDESAAHGFLEAAWQLGRDPASNPLLIAKLIRLAQLRYELLVLRRKCSLDENWRRRLDALELRPQALRALQLDGWVFQSQARAGRFFNDPEMAQALENFDDVVTLQRLMLLHYAEAIQDTVERLRTEDPLALDPQALFHEQYERIPRWSIMSRMFFPNFFDMWHKTLRTELVREHVVRILEIRTQLARGHEYSASRSPSTEIPGLDWLIEPVSEGVRIRLDGNLDAGEKHPVALDFTVERSACD